MSEQQDKWDRQDRPVQQVPMGKRGRLVQERPAQRDRQVRLVLVKQDQQAWRVQQGPLGQRGPQVQREKQALVSLAPRANVAQQDLRATV